MAFNEIVLQHQPREAQIIMRDFFAANVKNSTKFTLIDSPVGTGKSFGAVMMMDWYHREYDSRAKFDVLTNSKILQEQYTRDFLFMHSLWGKNNYRCDRFSCDCGVGAKLAAAEKSKCIDCPYDEARESFFGSQVSLTNFHLFVTYKVHVPEAWEQKRDAKVLIIDEAHEFDTVFCDFITSKLSKFILKKCGFSDKDALQEATYFSNITSIDAYAKAIEERLMTQLTLRLRAFTRDKQGADETEAKKLITLIEAIERQLTSWSTFLTEYNDEPDNWVLEVSDNNSNNRETLVQPVWAYPYLNKYVWSHYDHVVLMSGTILDKELFCFMNGLRTDSTKYISIPSPFPVENRLIYYFPVGKMNYHNKDTTYGQQEPYIIKILNKHKNDKGIIHTFSYENMNRVINGVQDERLLHHDSSTRTAVLNRHIATNESTVLVSPSMMTGIDLQQDLSRFQVLMKVPYPNLSSKKIKRRMDANNDWYSWKTCCDILQMCGRSVRSETDHANTYVLDSCFGDILKYSSRFFPAYFKESIIRINI